MIVEESQAGVDPLPQITADPSDRKPVATQIPED